MNGILPYYKEYEQSVLGAILCGHPEFTEELEATDFYCDNHRLIFNTFKRLKERSTPIDLLTVHQELERSKYLHEVESTYLAYLTEIFFPELNIEYYIDEIKKASTLRKMWEKLHTTAKSIEEGKSIEEIDDLLFQITNLELNNSNNSLKPVSASELESLPPPHSIWGDIIYEASVTLLNSSPGVGKTTICYNLSAYGSLGQEFLKLSFSKSIKVLYLDAETHKGLRKHKIENICGVLPPNFYFLDDVDFKKNFFKLLSICKRDKYDILVIDTLSRIIDFENENDNAEANFIMGLIRRLVKETGCSIVIVHHTSKSEMSKPVFRGRGASAISAAVDVIVNLEEIDMDTLILKVEKNRLNGNKTELLLKKVGDDRFEPHYPEIGQKSGFELYQAQDLILSMTPNEKLRKKEICELGIDKGFTERTIERAISGLVQSGKLKRLSKGVYMIVKIEVPDKTDDSARHNPDGIVGMARV